MGLPKRSHSFSHPERFKTDVNYTDKLVKQNILHRPKSGWQGRNATSDLQQEAKENRNFQRTQNRCNKSLHEHYHHARHIQFSKSAYDGFTSPQKCKGKGDALNIQGTYDPVQNRWIVPPRDLWTQPKAIEGKVDNSTPRRWRENSDQKYTKQKSPAFNGTLGECDPVLHRWMKLPKEPYQSVREKENGRIHGVMGYSGTAKVPDPQGHYNSLSHQWTQPPPGMTPDSDRTLKAFKCKYPKVLNSETWGQYDPLNNYWLVPSRNPAATGHPPRGSGRAKVPIPCDQGIYNPIINQWLVKPQNQRIVRGLSFAPRPQTVSNVQD